MSDLLRTEGLGKSFGSVRAVHDLSMRIEHGEMVAMMGRSGSGKSTAMHLLAGLEQPTTGNVYYKDQDLGGLDEDELALWRRANIGLIFQAFHLIPTLTAVENVAFPLYPEDISTAERKERSLIGLEMVGMSHRADHRPSELSGGEQQRVAIARALIGGPGLLFADEPTGNLDTDTGDEILRLFHKLRDEAGVAMLVVTHDKEVAAAADRIIEMRDGERVDA